MDVDDNSTDNVTNPVPDPNTTPDPSQKTLSFFYPRLPDDTDFEAFRKTDPTWLRIQNESEPLLLPGVFEEEEGKKRDRTRYIFQIWPRDPNGEILREMPEGKVAGNGIPVWGATLYDFYLTYKVPSITGMLSFLSGSRLAEFMREKGELVAEDQIWQAEKEEPKPKIMHPYDIGKFIELVEEQVHRKATGRSLRIDKTIGEKVQYSFIVCFLNFVYALHI